MDRDLASDRFMEFDGDDDALLIQRIDSNEIIYCPPKRKYKLVGKYVMGDKLGEGSYGKVKECLDSDTLQRRAVKIMKRKTLRRIPNGDQNVQREIRLLRRLKHRNVISLFHVYHNDEKGKIYMVMEFCVTGLQEMLDRAKDKKFPIWQAHMYFVQLVEGLEYLHSRGVVHKDIKPGNLLLSTDSSLKISDFGVAEQLDVTTGNDEITTSQGSPLFQPPEVAGGARMFPGFKVDVWSAGCTLFNLTSGKYPFEGENMFRLFENICEKPLVVPEELDPVLKSLLEGMLVKDPYQRMSLAQVKVHDWCCKKHPCTDEEVSVGGDDDRHSITIVPYLRYHYYDSESEDELITEHELNATRNQAENRSDLSATDLQETRGAHNKRRRRKPISCISVKSIASCKQS
ncbi:serine/threonine-protein kinase stk11-like [Homarus americanus]|uniref:serine/threonine-protein kinase stk11-like n=1 Tax=Homarus americanus TaxID=6706 RepID=UPI001C47E083|nr:serine/threonine-protein kinase stk11-like [Homarus americanus]